MSEMPRNEKEDNDKVTSGNTFPFCAITLTLINTPPSLKKLTQAARGYSAAQSVVVTSSS